MAAAYPSDERRHRAETTQARKLEFVVAAFMFAMAACFFGELSYLRPSAGEVVEGMFVPRLRGKGAAANAIALFGAIITP